MKPCRVQAVTYFAFAAMTGLWMQCIKSWQSHFILLILAPFVNGHQHLVRCDMQADLLQCKWLVLLGKNIRHVQLQQYTKA